MASQARINNLYRDQDEEAGATLGWMDSAHVLVNSESESMRFGQQVLDKNKTKLSGPVRVQEASSVQYGTIPGIVQHNSPTGGLIPSTLFTPFPRDGIGVDYQQLEMLVLLAMTSTILGGIALAT